MSWLAVSPDSTIASSVTLTVMVSSGKSVRICRCSEPAEGSTTTSNCRRSALPQTIRLTVPGALPSIRISRGTTTTASAIAGSVTAILTTSNAVGRTIERPDTSVSVSIACATAGAAWGSGGVWAPTLTTLPLVSATISVRLIAFRPAATAEEPKTDDAACRVRLIEESPARVCPP